VLALWAPFWAHLLLLTFKGPHMKYNPIDELHGSVNDIYEQYDKGQINFDETVEILARICEHFIKETE
jgi:hypothetical protein